LIPCLAAWSSLAARADTALLREPTGLADVAMWLASGAPGMVLVVVRSTATPPFFAARHLLSSPHLSRRS
jgi:hypothetical protein